MPRSRRTILLPPHHILIPADGPSWIVFFNLFIIGFVAACVITEHPVPGPSLSAPFGTTATYFGFLETIAILEIIEFHIFVIYTPSCNEFLRILKQLPTHPLPNPLQRPPLQPLHAGLHGQDRPLALKIIPIALDETGAAEVSG
jgi:hypothetical protein